MLRFALACSIALILAGCRDVSSFSTNGDHYGGGVIQADFVRSGIGTDVNACLTLDTDHLQDNPGTLSTSDGRFQNATLRPIPQIWHDPLSTFTFGDGRIRNLLYVVTATAPFADGSSDDTMVVVSLMQSGDVEVRLVRGAPALATDAATGTSDNLFAVFDLTRGQGPCSF